MVKKRCDQKENFYSAYLKFFWGLIKLVYNSMSGIWKLSRIKYAPISIFGGTHLDENSIYIKKAHQLAEMLSNANIPVLTGGGPGIMEAVTCGATHHKKNVMATVGISIKDLDPKTFERKCPTEIVFTDDFFSRKRLLIMHSVGFAIFPGGYGTLNELLELLTNMQTKRRPRAPIVLIGVEYWSSFVQWLKDFPLKLHLISPKDFELFVLTDDIKEAFSILKSHCPNQKFSIFLE